MGRSKPKPPPGETPFQKFERIARQIVSVPKTEIDRREAEWRRRKSEGINKPSP